MGAPLLLFVYAFLSNVALAVVPHEPVVIWYGAHLGVVPTAVVATAGTSPRRGRTTASSRPASTI